jgi:uncharacterized protein YdeI (YjbR/CyaY-like superfamily)
LDEKRFIRNFCKRNFKSKWSNNTLGYAQELIKKGMMKPQGLEYFKLGKKIPTHDVDIPKNPDMPLELKRKLSNNKKAKETFENYPPSTKRMLYRWILSGKLRATREKRVKEIMRFARVGKRVS